MTPGDKFRGHTCILLNQKCCSYEVLPIYSLGVFLLCELLDLINHHSSNVFSLQLQATAMDHGATLLSFLLCQKRKSYSGQS